MDRAALTNGVSTAFLHPHSPPHHVRRLAAFATDPPASPTTRRRRRQRKPWRKLLWVQSPSRRLLTNKGKTRLPRQLH